MTPTCPTCGRPMAVTERDGGWFRVRIRHCPACSPTMGGWGQGALQIALLGWACVPAVLPCRDEVLVVSLTPQDWTRPYCSYPEATLEPIATEHPGSLAYLCRCPVPVVEAP